MENKYETRIELVRKKAGEMMPSLSYHNFAHATDVEIAVTELARAEALNNEDLFILRSAAWLHDIIYVLGRQDNEERSAAYARQYLPEVGYSAEQTERIAQLISATKLPTNPSNIYEKIMCDADLYNLGGNEFMKKGEQIREENNLPEGHEWYRKQLGFIKSHEYYTESAKRLRDNRKRANISVLERLIEETA